MQFFIANKHANAFYKKTYKKIQKDSNRLANERFYKDSLANMSRNIK